MKNSTSSPIPEIIEAYKNGEMVILIDDENRENEGDLLAPASSITAEKINFMATHARGLICLTLTKQRCDYLNLPLMTRSSDEQNNTNFTLSIEAKEGVTTGISAKDRARTIQVATDPNASANDITSPGHIFPVRARDGGVLVRAGHTEAGCDLARLAGMPIESSVIVEIMKDNGDMARLPDLQQFAKKHHLKLGTIESLIRYRLEKENLMQTVANDSQKLSNGTKYQLITYWDKVDHINHYAMVFGDPKQENETTWVRVHLQNYLNDTLKPYNPINAQDPSRSWRLHEVIDFIAQQSKSGIVVLLNQPQSSSAQNQAYVSNGITYFDEKNYGKGAQILNLLGVKKMSVLGSKSTYSGIRGFGLEVSDFLTKNDYDNHHQ